VLRPIAEYRMILYALLLILLMILRPEGLLVRPRRGGTA
jgi:ABC-type branched-subunit amino acid transport system permease subunit